MIKCTDGRNFSVFRVTYIEFSGCKGLKKFKLKAMKLTMFAFNLLVASVVSGGPAWKETQRGSGLRIGEKSGILIVLACVKIFSTFLY